MILRVVMGLDSNKRWIQANLSHTDVQIFTDTDEVSCLWMREESLDEALQREPMRIPDQRDAASFTDTQHI